MLVEALQLGALRMALYAITRAVGRGAPDCAQIRAHAQVCLLRFSPDHRPKSIPNAFCTGSLEISRYRPNQFVEKSAVFVVASEVLLMVCLFFRCGFPSRPRWDADCNAV